MDYKQLGHKMNKVIESASLDQKEVVERYLCLANRYLHNICCTYNAFGIAGMSYAIKHNFEAKFGYFYTQPEAIKEIS